MARRRTTRTAVPDPDAGVASPDQLFAEFDSPLSDLFQGQSRPPGPRPGIDLRFDLWLGFVEAAEGCERNIPVDRRVRCDTCLNTDPQPQPCTSCRGLGYRVARESLRVKIPPGVDTGHVLRLKGKGEESLDGGATGHLLFTLQVRPHESLARSGSDIVSDVVIPRELARSGGPLSVPCLHGSVEVAVPPNTRTGDNHRLVGCGAVRLGSKPVPFPIPGDAPYRAADTDNRGCHIITFVLEGDDPPPRPQPEQTGPATRRPRVIQTSLPRGTWVGIIAVLAFIVAVFGLWFYQEWWSRGSLGERCYQNRDCRSEICLSQKRPTPIYRGGPLFAPTAKIGFCSEECQSDDDCPTSMVCGGAQSHARIGVVLGRGAPIRLCMTGQP